MTPMYTCPNTQRIYKDTSGVYMHFIVLRGRDIMCFHTGFFLRLVSDLEDGGELFLRNLC
jgi:hypothetical protein